MSRDNEQLWDAALSNLRSFARAKVEETLGNDKPPFPAFVIDTLEADVPRGAPGHDASMLLHFGIVTDAVSDPSLLSLEQALRMGRAALVLDRNLDLKLLRRLTNRVPDWPRDVPRERAMRVLQVVDSISDCRRLAMPLIKFLKLPDSHLRSKAVKLLARATQNRRWADSILKNPDPRVRCNLIEGVAQQLGRRAAALLEKGAEDPHHRVATTSLMYLCRLGDEQSRERLEQLAAAGTDRQRRAAEWALRQIELQPVVESMELAEDIEIPADCSLVDLKASPA